MPNPFKIVSNAACLMLLLGVLGCHHVTKEPDKKVVKKTQKVKPKEYKEIIYTEPQLLAFFDSVGRLTVQPLADSFFYKYDGDKIIPVLNELKNSNLLQPSPWGIREIWLESTIQSTNPLIMKVVYRQQFQDTAEFDHYEADPKRGPMIVNDSTLIKYTWNAKTKKLEAQFSSSKISRPQILSYYLLDNELLFINTHHQRLKKMLLNKKKKIYILHYLNNIKNYQNEPPEHLSISDPV